MINFVHDSSFLLENIICDHLICRNCYNNYYSQYIRVCGAPTCLAQLRPDAFRNYSSHIYEQGPVPQVSGQLHSSVPSSSQHTSHSSASWVVDGGQQAQQQQPYLMDQAQQPLQLQQYHPQYQPHGIQYQQRPEYYRPYHQAQHSPQQQSQYRQQQYSSTPTRPSWYDTSPRVANFSYNQPAHSQSPGQEYRTPSLTSQESFHSHTSSGHQHNHSPDSINYDQHPSYPAGPVSPYDAYSPPHRRQQSPPSPSPQREPYLFQGDIQCPTPQRSFTLVPEPHQHLRRGSPRNQTMNW